jgi:hypothetical protein
MKNVIYGAQPAQHTKFFILLCFEFRLWLIEIGLICPKILHIKSIKRNTVFSMHYVTKINKNKIKSMPPQAIKMTSYNKQTYVRVVSFVLGSSSIAVWSTLLCRAMPSNILYCQKWASFIRNVKLYKFIENTLKIYNNGRNFNIVEKGNKSCNQ